MSFRGLVWDHGLDDTERRKMETLWWIVGFSLLGSAGVVAGAGTLLLFRQAIWRRLISSLVSFAVGTLLGGAFLGLLPRALEGSASLPVFSTVLAGLVLFFILEKWVLWRHCHDPECPADMVAGRLILLGDAIHNFFDGIVIAASFLSAPALGVSSALAVVAHEIPQEVGDFAILLHSGYSKGRALAYNLLSSATTPAGAVIAFFALSDIGPLVPYVLAISAASFLYIAMSDLVPGLHRVISVQKAVLQVAFIVAGILTMAAIRALSPG
ncbi:MAG TPA: ZIP family metal transporter [Terriglobia bacterium]|nr:ZIP family metal transporter [Terriglobia bacterium]